MQLLGQHICSCFQWHKAIWGVLSTKNAFYKLKNTYVFFCSATKLFIIKILTGSMIIGKLMFTEPDKSIFLTR